ncbi:DnaJ C-terminal domain-containing protein [Insolitispirillum peregrinum]|uniref:DnaJ-class molecular chaperone with C-terminal Zn finger domain n=1 Tax=Insolitispirillum peregrinum TaxID=80876 RepID=A0A1N7JAI8_9PROT|nr:DnaJ C-terminal domain-containing protein [Insolitispirillum peregrinum]SIS46359.1 DnaJ-class molecular chaperone with C-terminal Zn finger domain [Insolitispirillum peregrinum]
MTVGVQDPYRLLGVLRTADERTIRSAYRQKVKDCHPDLHPGDRQAEERFKALSVAYAILNDADKRRRYDRGELGPDGTARARQSSAASSGPDFGGMRGHNKPFRDPYLDESFDEADDPAIWQSRTQGASPHSRDDFAPPPPPADDDLTDLFREIFQDGASRPQAGRGSGGNGLRGRDVRYTLTLSFAEACYGTRKRLPLNTGRDVTVPIPPASENGQVIRLSGQGQHGATAALAGDLLVELQVQPHPFFTRKGLDLHALLSLNLAEALRGGRITMTGLRGQLAVMVPAGIGNGQVLRVSKLGLRAGEMTGDLYLTIAVVLPPNADDALTGFVSDWIDRNPYHLPGR